MPILLERLRETPADAVAVQTAASARTYGELVRAIESAPSRAGVPREHVSGDPWGAIVALAAAEAGGGPVFFVHRDWPGAWRDYCARGAGSAAAGERLYVVASSGTLGCPKLISVTRGNWASFLDAIAGFYRWRPGTRVAAAFEDCFDPFFAFAYLALSQGATLFPLDERARIDPAGFCAANRIEIWGSVPSLAARAWKRKSVRTLPDLRLSVFTGERLTADFARGWARLAPKSRIENLYGPAETTVWLTRHVYDPENDVDSVPIGAPLPGCHLRVEAGELVARGPQVAEGYLTPDGLRAFDGIYRTGDLVADEGGRYRFLGRADSQVKIAGHRVELEAIEDLLRETTGEPCAAFVRGDSGEDRVAVAFPTAVDAIRAFAACRDRLPPVFRPREFWRISPWPASPTGKIDRGALARAIDEGRAERIDDGG